MKVINLAEDNLMRLSFNSSDNFYRTVENIRPLPGRFFDPKKKTWFVPISVFSISKLLDSGFIIESKELENWYIQKSAPVVKKIPIPGLKGQLRPFQEEGVVFIEYNNGRVLLGDEMGLGKTCQSLAWLQLHPELRPAIIVVPATLKLNWAKEIKKWMPDEPHARFSILEGRPDLMSEVAPLKPIIIINYDILTGFKQNKGWGVVLKKLKPKVIIGDEIHYIKNSKAHRSKSFKKLCKGIDHIICISGTPITSRPNEFYNCLKLIDPTLFPSLWAYHHRYCGAKHNGFGWNFNGASNTEELHKIVTEQIMLRRLKKDVLKELPEKIRIIVPMEMDNKSEYQEAERDIIAWIYKTEGKAAAERAKKAKDLVEEGKLKQLAVKGKMTSAIIWIQNFLESGEKLVVFAVHKKIIKSLMDNFKKVAVKLDGSIISKEERERAVTEFQTNDSVRLFIGQIRSAGVGITLHAASNTCFLEFSDTPAEHDQAEDRVHRIGQTSDSINAWYLIAEGTIENKLALRIDKKRNVTTALLDGDEVPDAQILTKLIEKEKRSRLGADEQI